MVMLAERLRPSTPRSERAWAQFKSRVEALGGTDETKKWMNR